METLDGTPSNVDFCREGFRSCEGDCARHSARHIANVALPLLDSALDAPSILDASERDSEGALGRASALRWLYEGFGAISCGLTGGEPRRHWPDWQRRRRVLEESGWRLLQF